MTSMDTAIESAFPDLTRMPLGGLPDAERDDAVSRVLPDLPPAAPVRTPFTSSV
jgi:hypothetical protein